MPKREYVLSEFNGRKNNITVILETKRKGSFAIDLMLIEFTTHLDAVGVAADILDNSY